MLGLPRGKAWLPCGQSRAVRAIGQRVSVHMLSAVGTGAKLKFMLHEGLGYGAAFRTFLE